MSPHVNKVIQLLACCVEGGVYLFPELLIDVLEVVRLERERRPEVADVLRRLQLGDPRREHQAEQRDEEVAVAPQLEVRRAADVLELLVAGVRLAAEHVGVLGGELERGPLALHAELHLEVSEEVAKVDVEEVPTLCDHHVVSVAVANAEDVRSYTVRGTRHHERLDALVPFSGYKK